MSQARFPEGVSGKAIPQSVEPGTNFESEEIKSGTIPSVFTHVRQPGYDFARFEAKWRERWEMSKLYQVDLRNARKPFYNLMMFPYPSAEGLHVGNMYSYIGADIQGRYKAMQGYDVFEPIGFDAFGIHSENFAIKQGVHPKALTRRNIEHFREQQLKRIGNRFDWSSEIHTTEPSYYHWTQWIFTQLFKAGLAERKAASVNWCPRDKTVLADEQVINGHCERCDTIVEKRWLEQWFFKITKYAQKLLDDLDTLDWSERVKSLQRHWIGRSEGLEFEMEVVNIPGTRIQAYTTRPDTIYGVTFVALAARHPLVDVITSEKQRTEVHVYQEQVSKLPVDAERGATGVFTGAYARHPLTGESLPIWITDYVLEGYGTGAIMGVPAHDQTDMVFARAQGLPVRFVIRSGDGTPASNTAQAEANEEDGILYDSGEFTGLTSAQAREAIISWSSVQGLGRHRVSYRLRDWLISRQRYWGPPIPIIYCPEHGAVPVPDEQLPVLLPDVEDWMPTGSGASPLANIESFVNTTCPICGKPARRETDVNDNFLDSAWYYLRYLSKHDDIQAWDPELARKWLPVDMYIGGAEHSVLHLMYTRFITLALHDLGLLDFEEPFKQFRANGLITRDGAKISKSRGNIIVPDDYIDHFGADAFRVYLLFMGPYEAGGDFSDRGIGGVVRFLDRVWRLVTQQRQSTKANPASSEATRAMHLAIKRVGEDTANLKYNTAIAATMEYLNGLVERGDASRAELETLLLLLAPYAPYITEELWEQLGHTESVHITPWPVYDAEVIQTNRVTIVIQVNGRVRASIEVATSNSAEEIQCQAQANERVQHFIAGQPVQRVIYVPNRLINIVTG
ncbi:leucine--tRNA ligase [Ktedonospora formicarum]|uniref:Leucine--tRNA ligase n=1 Tax=Ktedonospora formicarum TaxID=2778364 RepID=A0A8J3I7Y8_9CHLR|nr:leucine--tRNA ligase [Ktedonospora formicarum]GHO46359.1 leucine--tRNA ligase [Ktedonospora formicarum]